MGSGFEYLRKGASRLALEFLTAADAIAQPISPSPDLQAQFSERLTKERTKRSATRIPEGDLPFFNPPPFATERTGITGLVYGTIFEARTLLTSIPGAAFETAKNPLEWGRVVLDFWGKLGEKRRSAKAERKPSYSPFDVANVFTGLGDIFLRGQTLLGIVNILPSIIPTSFSPTIVKVLEHWMVNRAVEATVNGLHPRVSVSSAA